MRRTPKTLTNIVTAGSCFPWKLFTMLTVAFVCKIRMDCSGATKRFVDLLKDRFHRIHRRSSNREMAFFQKMSPHSTVMPKPRQTNKFELPDGRRHGIDHVCVRDPVELINGTVYYTFRDSSPYSYGNMGIYVTQPAAEISISTYAKRIFSG